LRAAKALNNQNRIEKAAKISKELSKIVKELEKGKECQNKDNKLLRLVLEDETIITDEKGRLRISTISFILFFLSMWVP